MMVKVLLLSIFSSFTYTVLRKCKHLNIRDILLFSDKENTGGRFDPISIEGNL